MAVASQARISASVIAAGAVSPRRACETATSGPTPYSLPAFPNHALVTRASLKAPMLGSSASPENVTTVIFGFATTGPPLVAATGNE